MTTRSRLSKEDPWDSIDVPLTEVNARRVDPRLRRDWFWGRDTDGGRLLILEAQFKPKRLRLPAIRGLDIRVMEGRGDKLLIVIKLTDMDGLEPFRRICDDMISFLDPVESDDLLADKLSERFGLWRRLLDKRPDGLLSDEEQRGLAAELLFLRDVWLPALSAEAAIAGWQGPLGASQDFRHGFRAIEVKSLHPGRDTVLISSAEQLWFDGQLFLVAWPVELVERQENDNGESLLDVARQIRERLVPEAQDVYDSRLAEARFADNEAYARRRLIYGSPQCFKIEPGFPRLDRTAVPEGISAVRYALELRACGCYRVQLAESVEGLDGIA